MKSQNLFALFAWAFLFEASMNIVMKMQAQSCLQVKQVKKYYLSRHNIYKMSYFRKFCYVEMLIFHTVTAAIILQYDQQKKATVEVTNFESEVISICNCAKKQSKVGSVSRGKIICRVSFSFCQFEHFCLHLYVATWFNLILYIHVSVHRFQNETS